MLALRLLSAAVTSDSDLAGDCVVAIPLRSNWRGCSVLGSLGHDAFPSGYDDRSDGPRAALLGLVSLYIDSGALMTPGTWACFHFGFCAAVLRRIRQANWSIYGHSSGVASGPLVSCWKVWCSLC